MAYKTHLKNIGSTKSAGVGFLPGPKVIIPPEGEITTPNGTDLIPAVITLTGEWLDGSSVSVDFNTDVPSSGTGEAIAAGDLTSNQMANDLADDLDSNTNISANAVGNTVEVLAIGLASTVDLTNLVITPN